MTWIGKFIDSHCHLQEHGLQPYLSQILDLARQVGVRFMMSNGTSELDWQPLLDLSRSEPAIIPSLGLHPWYVSTRSKYWATTLESLLANTNSGVGEIGLDGSLQHQDKAAQTEVLEEQLDIAHKFNRPVTLHCVRAWERLLNLLIGKNPALNNFVLHSYGGSAEMARRFLDLGGYLSFSAKILNPDCYEARKAFLLTPLDRLLLESDAPNLPQVEHCHRILGTPDGRVLSEPGNLDLLAAEFANLRGISIASLVEAVWQNSYSVFQHILPTQGPDRT